MVRREVEVPATATRVWDALTHGPDLSRWFGAEMDVEARPGGRVVARWSDGTERRGTVEEAVSGRRLSFRWAPFERDAQGRAVMVAPTRVQFELQETPRGTVLVVVEEPLASPPVREVMAR